MQTELIIFQLIVLLYSVILHEIAHGWAALKFGDHTAEYMGRLTLNPIPHLDMFGSILLPFMLYLGNSPFLFGWAKPVPVNESNLKPYKLGSFVVSVAGVATNFLLAVFFVVFAKVSDSDTISTLCYIGALTNFALAIFNLIPIPPADGYRILENILPYRLRRSVDSFFARYGVFAMILSIPISIIIFRQIFPLISNTLYNFIF
jgi:Zn-dependent protease